ncbi:hypothetical protein AGMMS4957_15130 [Bacteroidia bacterium]|nr:hypothetical protein AGMMS4957_15130 [Bacteroidia bacterium]
MMKKRLVLKSMALVLLGATLFSCGEDDNNNKVEDLTKGLAGTYSGIGSMGGVPMFPGTTVKLTVVDPSTLHWDMDLDLSPLPAEMGVTGAFKLKDFPLTVTKVGDVLKVNGSGSAIDPITTPVAPITPHLTISGTIGATGIDVTITPDEFSALIITYQGTKEE